MNVQETVEFLVERTLENKQVSTSYFETKEQVLIEIGSYPKGVTPARKVLDELFDWAVDIELDNVVEKIIELEKRK